METTIKAVSIYQSVGLTKTKHSRVHYIKPVNVYLLHRHIAMFLLFYHKTTASRRMHR